MREIAGVKILTLGEFRKKTVDLPDDTPIMAVASDTEEEALDSDRNNFAFVDEIMTDEHDFGGEEEDEHLVILLWICGSDT